MNAQLARALFVLAVLGVVAYCSARSFFRGRTAWRLIQLLGAGFLGVVVLAHICESLALFPRMQWGAHRTVGHYLDLISGILGVTLLAVGYLAPRMIFGGDGRRRNPGRMRPPEGFD